MCTEYTGDMCMLTSTVVHVHGHKNWSMGDVPYSVTVYTYWAQTRGRAFKISLLHFNIKERPVYPLDV